MEAEAREEQGRNQPARPWRGRRGLGSLIHPHEPKAFLDHYWPHQAFVNHGSPDRFATIMRSPQLANLHEMLQAKRRFIRVWIKDPRNGAHRTAIVTPSQAEDLYASGAVTISIDGFETPALARLMGRMSRDMGTPLRGMSCNAYISPAGKGTTALHFDDHEVFVLQLRGRKQWGFAPNTHVPSPPEDYAVGTQLSPTMRKLCSHLPDVLPADAQTVVLCPGSVLFLPKGYWHLTHALEESVHLTLAVASLAWIDVVMERLRDRLIRQEAWRRTAAGLAGPGRRSVRAKGELSLLVSDLTRALGSILDPEEAPQFDGRTQETARGLS